MQTISAQPLCKDDIQTQETVCILYHSYKCSDQKKSCRTQAEVQHRPYEESLPNCYVTRRKSSLSHRLASHGMNWQPHELGYPKAKSFWKAILTRGKADYYRGLQLVRARRIRTYRVHSPKCENFVIHPFPKAQGSPWKRRQKDFKNQRLQRTTENLFSRQLLDIGTHSGYIHRPVKDQTSQKLPHEWGRGEAIARWRLLWRKKQFS